MDFHQFSANFRVIIKDVQGNRLKRTEIYTIIVNMNEYKKIYIHKIDILKMSFLVKPEMTLKNKIHPEIPTW